MRLGRREGKKDKMKEENMKGKEELQEKIRERN